MRREWVFWFAWCAFVVAWMLPVHKNGVTLPHGVPGWQAFRVAAAPVWPYEGVEVETWWGATLTTLSAATNIVMLGLPWMRKGVVSHSRLIVGATFAAFIVNAQWLFLNTEWADLRAGYYLWWTSFLAMSFLWCRTAMVGPRGSSEEKAAQHRDAADQRLL
jgi:hypothetical protein